MSGDENSLASQVSSFLVPYCYLLLTNSARKLVTEKIENVAYKTSGPEIQVAHEKSEKEIKDQIGNWMAYMAFINFSYHHQPHFIDEEETETQNS